MVSKYASVGVTTRAFLARMKASSWVYVQRKSLRGLRRDLNVASTFAMLFVLEASWLVRLKKEQRSVRLLGVGNLSMASVMSLLME